MSRHQRRRAARRQRRIALITMLIVLLLAIGGMAVWMVADRRPEKVMQRYPMEYEDLIRRCAAENDLPPAYVAGVILAESSYDPEAVSSADARGLIAVWGSEDTGEKPGEVTKEVFMQRIAPGPIPYG